MRAFCVQRVCTAPLSGSSVSWLLLRLHLSEVFFASMVQNRLRLESCFTFLQVDQSRREGGPVLSA